MTRTAAPTHPGGSKTHPKLLAVMVPRGSSRGGKRQAVVEQVASHLAIGGTVQLVGPDPDAAAAFASEAQALAATKAADPTKVAADAFAQAHPEGTKALLAKLMAEKAQREADRVYVVDGATYTAVTARVAGQRPITTPVAWVDKSGPAEPPLPARPTTAEVPETSAAVVGSRPRQPTQSTRMLRLACASATCGYTVRTTRKWIAIGLPLCPVDGQELAE